MYSGVHQNTLLPLDNDIAGNQIFTIILLFFKENKS